MKKILLVQLASMGDCLFATTIARQIKEVDYPGAHLTWLIGDRYAQVLAGNPHVDRIVPVEIPSPEGGREMLPSILRNVAGKKNEYDEIIITEYVPENYAHFYGTTRSGFFRAYGRPITVPVEPLIFLDNDELAHVADFAKRHNLAEPGAWPILFECSPKAGQSPVTPEMALDVCRRLRVLRPEMRFVLSSNLKIESGDPAIVDASCLTWRENAELTKYCKLLVGCSSGITWLNTSNAAAKLPMIQNLCSEKEYFGGVVSPSVELDFILNGLPTDQLVELVNADVDEMVECILLVVENSFAAAKARFPGRVRPRPQAINEHFRQALARREGQFHVPQFRSKPEMREERGVEHVIFTIVARNYIGQAAALGKSLAQNAPNVRFLPFICDTVREESEQLFAARPDLLERFEWMFLDDLEYPNVRAMVLRYDPTEFCTSVKPALFLQHVARYPGALVSYFDPDIIVYGPLDELEAAMRDASFTLIPHFMSDPYDEGAIDAHGVMSAGIYNLGYCGVNGKFDETARILRWWRDKLEFECVSRQPLFFVDQKWMDFIPAFAEYFRIFRHPGYNTAYWNLHEREFSEDAGRILVNGKPLKFYHFSGYTPVKPDQISKYQSKLVLDDLPLLKRLMDDYARRLLAEGYLDFAMLEYANNYSLKTRQFIPPQLRAEFVAMGKNVSHLSFDPFEDPWVQKRLDSRLPDRLYPTLDPPRVTVPKRKLRVAASRNFDESHVIDAYRNLLGREPESDAAIEHHLKTAVSKEALEISLKASPEYQARIKR